MKHRQKGRKLGREKKLREALMKTLLGSFVLHGKIRTTEAKAKELRPIFEKLVTSARKKSTNIPEMKKFISSQLPPVAVKKIPDILELCKDRKGGYVRITKIEQRKNDGAKMAIIEIVK